MKTKKRQKLCYNCEGEVDMDVIVCPFCAADLRDEKPELSRADYDPISPTRNMPHQPLYPPRHPPAEEEPLEENITPHSYLPKQEELEEEKSPLSSIFLLALGSQLFLLSIFMLVFSQKGTLFLSWDARYWLLYFLAAVPLIGFGYKGLSGPKK